MVLTSGLGVINSDNVTQAAVSMDENSYNFYHYVPNKTDNQNLTYSIRGIASTDPRYQPTVDGLKMWNRSNYIEFTKKVSPANAKVNNHVFIEFVDADYNPNPSWAGLATCGNRVYFYKKTKNINALSMQKLAAHEVGHTLGYADEPTEGLLMSHIVDPNVDFIKKYFDGLYFRYNTTKGKDLYNPVKRTNQLNACHDRGIKNIDDSQSTVWPVSTNQSFTFNQNDYPSVSH